MSLVPFRRWGRLVPYVLVGAITFMLGGATVVVAVPPNPPLFSLADNVDPTHTATVNAAGELSTVDAGSRSRLASIDAATGKLTFDGSNALRVTQQGQVTLTNSDFPDAGTHSRLDAIQATTDKLTFDASGRLQTAVTGTVNVGNFPTTQNVNVTGGSLAISSSLATESQFFVLSTQPGFTKAKSFPTINASLIIVDPRRSDVSFAFFNNTPSGINPTYGFRSPPGPLVIPLNQRIPVNSVQITCFNVVGDCEPTIAIVGD
jgi:hypothetical protein